MLLFHPPVPRAGKATDDNCRSSAISSTFFTSVRQSSREFVATK